MHVARVWPDSFGLCTPITLSFPPSSFDLPERESERARERERKRQKVTDATIRRFFFWIRFWRTHAHKPEHTYAHTHVYTHARTQTHTHTHNTQAKSPNSQLDCPQCKNRVYAPSLSPHPPPSLTKTSIISWGDINFLLLLWIHRFPIP